MTASENHHYQGEYAKYVPADEAGRLFGYTGNYVRRLVRERKIIGAQIKHQWFVDPESLGAFVRNISRQKVIQNQSIREVRIEEQKIGHILSKGGLVSENRATLADYSILQPQTSTPTSRFRPVFSAVGIFLAGVIVTLLPLTHPITRTQALLATTPADAYHTLASLAATAYHNARALNDRIEQ
ncbi:hypothetical protein HY416_03200, partial [Candidatus Kaiserbacteria bacterium]|nr:hypothetical protein [Candidatus Kaiserbacteria bacterium]